MPSIKKSSKSSSRITMIETPYFSKPQSRPIHLVYVKIGMCNADNCHGWLASFLVSLSCMMETPYVFIPKCRAIHLDLCRAEEEYIYIKNWVL